MSSKAKLLIVEGEGDKEFFEALFLAYKIKGIEIDVVMPNEIDSEQKNGKSGVFKTLLSEASKLKDENYHYTHLACVIDTDYKNDGHDISKRLKQLEKDIMDYNYDSFHQHETTGYYFSSPHAQEGFNNIGIWFMPNNQDEGMFEDWLLKVGNQKEEKLIEYASHVCSEQEINKHTGESKRFKNIKDAKAKIAIWTALQKEPHLGVENIIKDKLYNEQSPDFQNFISWLKFIYQ